MVSQVREVRAGLLDELVPEELEEVIDETALVELEEDEDIKLEEVDTTETLELVEVDDREEDAVDIVEEVLIVDLVVAK